MSCKHPSLFQNMCVVCGMKVQQTAPPNSSAARSGAGQPNGWKLAMNVSGGKVLQLSAEEAASVTASKVSNLKNSKKLALVLDLDHTLLHAVQIEGQTPSRTSATARVIEGTVGVGSGDGLEDNVVHHLPIEEIDRMTVKHLVMKKRPFLDEFLEKASEFCQMTVYTAGTRRYAEAVAKVVDPTRRYFADRIVARCDVANIRADGNDKSLERIYPGDASMAVIIDDREDVWRGPQGQQLLMVKPFVHFDPRPSEAAAAATGKPGENASAPLADALGTISRGASVVGNGAAAAVLSPVITLCSSPSGEPAGRIAKVAPLYSFEHSCLDDQLRRCLQVLLEIHAQFYSTPGTSNNSNGAESGSDASNTTSVESKSEGNGNGGSAAPTPPPPPSSTNSSALAALSLQQPLPLPSPPSVGNILRSIKKKVLAGCTLTFSGLIPTNEENPRNHSLWRLAEALGAQVSLELLPRTTHLISVHTQTLKVTAVLQKRASEVWVLHPDWLIYCRWSLSRACEATFMLNQLAPGQAQPCPVMDFSPLPASALPPPLHSGAVRKESLVDVPQAAAAGLSGSRDSSEQLRSSLKRSREEDGRAHHTHTNGARPSATTAPEEDNSMMSTLKKLKAVGHTSNGSGSVNNSSSRDAQAFIRRPNGAFPPVPTPITTGGDQNGGSATNRGPSPTSSSASSSARSQLFAQAAGASAAALSTASSGGGSSSGSGGPIGIIKKKVVGIYLEDSPRGRAEGTKSLSKPLGEEKSYLVPYDAGSGEDDYFSAAAMAVDAPAPSPRDSASQRDRRSDSEGSGGHAPVFNDNDVLSDSEDGEVREGQDGGASSSSDDNSLAGSGSGARRRATRANKHRGGRRSSDGETEDGYYLGSGGEEEEEDQQEQDPSDEGMLCCNDDQGSTCSATGSSYLLEDDGEEGEGDGEEERGGGKRWHSTGSRRSGIEERENGFGDDNSRRAHLSNSHTFLSNSNVTASDAHSRAAAARRSDSNSSMSNHSSSDDDGSDFEDMMNRRRLLTGSGGGGTIVEAEDDEDADFGYSDGQE